MICSVKVKLTVVVVNFYTLHCVASNVTPSVSVTGVISEWEGGAHEGSHIESNHVLLHSTVLFNTINLLNY